MIFESLLQRGVLGRLQKSGRSLGKLLDKESKVFLILEGRFSDAKDHGRWGKMDVLIQRLNTLGGLKTVVLIVPN